MMKNVTLKLAAAILISMAVSCGGTSLSGDASTGDGDARDDGDGIVPDPAGDDGQAEVADADVPDDDAPPPVCPAGTWADILFEFQADGRIVSTPAVGADGTVYFGTENATLYAVDCFGAKRWEWKYGCVDYCPQAFEGSAALAEDGTIYVGDDIAVPNYFFALSPDGSLKWTYETWLVYGQMDASPAITADGTIFAGGHGDSEIGPVGQLVALLPDGRVLDGFPMPTQAITGSPAVIGPSVIVGQTGMNGLSLRNSVFAAIDSAEKIWETPLSQAGDYVYEFISLSSIAVDVEGRIVVAENWETSRASSLVLIDAGSGEVRRTIDLGSGQITVGAPVVGPALFGEDIILAMDGGRLVSANPDSGGVIFTFDIQLGAGMKGSPVLGDDGFIYAAAGNMLYRVSKTGEIVDNIANPLILSDTVTSSLAMGPGGVLYMGTETGRLIAAGTGAGGLDPVAPWPTMRHDEHNTGRADSLDCDGLHGTPCPDDSYFCEHPAGTCRVADELGTCIEIPDSSMCPDYDICPDVCGCDGVTYCSDCERRAASVSKDHDGPCGE
jgi:outer membrane protein assembly factor BamB